MKKILLATIIFLSCIGLHAQSVKCNRLLIHQGSDTTIYNIKKIDSLSFERNDVDDNLVVHGNNLLDKIGIDNIDSLSFKNVEGRVAADINIISLANPLKLDVTRTPSCVGFKITCLPFSSINGLMDDDLIKFISDNVEETYYEDLKDEEVTGLELERNTEYVLITVGIDKYGLLCDITKKRFSLPDENLAGNPEVKVTVVENNLYDFRLKFEPNSDVSKYSTFLAEKGETENQFAMFAYAFGWYSISDMLKDDEWCMVETGKYVHQYTDKSPNTVYELYYMAWDVNGIAAPYEVFEFKTMAKGGEGTAEVKIELGEYKLEAWTNNNWETEWLPSQFFTFTPNDQTSAYRFDVYLAKNYNADPDGYKDDLCSEPFTTTKDWYQYETLSTDFQINPNTECVAIAAAKNINDEWGPVTELFFTTPNETSDKSGSRAAKATNDDKQRYKKLDSLSADDIIKLVIKR